MHTAATISININITIINKNSILNKLFKLKMQADDKNKKIFVSEFESSIDSKILESIYKGADYDPNHDDDSDNQDFLSNNLLTEREQSPDPNNNQRCYDEDEESVHVYLDNMDMYEDSDICEEWNLNTDIESMYKPLDTKEVIEQVMTVQILVNKMVKEDPIMAKKYRVCFLTRNFESLKLD